jgi:hypothetical protein
MQFYCELQELPISWPDGPRQMWQRRYEQFAVKTRPRVLATHTGHPNMSCSQSSFLDLPRSKSKLESELWQNPPDL